MQSYFMLSMLLYYFIFKNMKWKLSFTSLNDLQPTLCFSPSKSSMRRQVVEAVHGISTQLGLQLHEVLCSSKGLCRPDFGAVRINVSFWHASNTFPQWFPSESNPGQITSKGVNWGRVGHAHYQAIASVLCRCYVIFCFIPFPFNSSSFEMVFGQKKVEEMSEGQYVAFEVSDPWCGGSVLAADLLKT